MSFKSWPFRSKRWKPLYVVGVLADMNGDPEEINPETFFKGQYFYGLEVGYNWKRQFPKDFDHAHVNVWYADERSEPYDTPGIFPNRPGWGFKLAGTKQWGKFCAFAKYTFNDAKGGGLGLTWAKNSASVGCVFLDPFCLSGELGLGLSWLDPHVNLLPGAFAMPRDQYGIDLYWKLLATPNLWVTPGVQFIFDPSLNPTTDHLTVLGFKVRWFF